MKLLKPLQAVALVCAVSCPVFAADVDYQTISDAAQKTGDLSRQVLVMIFGDVEPGQPTLIGSLFAMLCTVALVWFLVVTLKSRYQGAGGTTPEICGGRRNLDAHRQYGHPHHGEDSGFEGYAGNLATEDGDGVPAGDADHGAAGGSDGQPLA